ncbi:hypothetical protein SAMN05421852_102243 [Thermoflavimicrobium dichotomicum]|uniref:Uncharacterized protein n=1 Tax=Thermoflavimicrobium dichotomicum TaxID=46223 RepID=A0A1I3LMC9_9BACL|nr:hypothetical protein SAMN05421852_102243 [Thermoflavimicrobium dichotomicum]
MDFEVQADQIIIKNGKVKIRRLYDSHLTNHAILHRQAKKDRPPKTPGKAVFLFFHHVPQKVRYGRVDSEGLAYSA